MTDSRRCPACRKQSMVKVGPVDEWSTNPPPIDAAEFSLWRCTTVTDDGRCGCEEKRKDDGSATRDPRWAPGGNV